MALLFDPIDSLLRLQRDIDRFYGKPLVDFGVSGPSVFPQINVFSREDGSFMVRAEVPGIRPEDVRVDIEPGRLTIAGERKAESPEQGGVHRRERGHGAFSRTLQLPTELAVTEATATVRNGVLTVQIPKHEKARPRQIVVDAA